MRHHLPTHLSFLRLRATRLLLVGMMSATTTSRGQTPEMMTGEKTSPSTASLAPATSKPVSRSEEILKRFDKNRDGRLDDDEKADAHEVMLAETMAKEAPPPSAQGLAFFEPLAIELFDRDHDGRLDEPERVAAMEFLEKGDPAAVRDTLQLRFDVNRDGKLDENERREAQAFTVEHRGEFMQQVLLRRFDVNSNGQLEAEEKTGVRAAFLNAPSPPTAEVGDPNAREKGSRDPAVVAPHGK